MELDNPVLVFVPVHRLIGQIEKAFLLSQFREDFWFLDW
jgi:hypothetical protein